MFGADLEQIDRYTPASANPELVKEVADMPGTGRAILERGIGIGRTEGIGIGRADAAKLMNHLWRSGRGKDAERAENDLDYLNQLIAEFGQKAHQT